MSDPVNPKPITEADKNSEWAYPSLLKQEEAKAVHLRRGASAEDVASQSPEMPADTVGLALSGGGIRSATFSLGVLQALADKSLLGQIDYLSTVSGGGYIGSFWGGWLNRLPTSSAPKPPAPVATAPSVGQKIAQTISAGLRGVANFVARPVAHLVHATPASVETPALGKTFAEAQKKLADFNSVPIRWLRENGRYLTPNGESDIWYAIAVAQRNFGIIHVVLGVLLLGLWVAVAVTGFVIDCCYSTDPSAPLGWSRVSLNLVHWTLSAKPHVELVFSPVPWLVVAVGLIATILAAWCYWIPMGRRWGGVWRNKCTLTQSWLFRNSMLALVIAAVDTAGSSLYGPLKEMLTQHPTGSTSLFAGAGSALLVVHGWIQKSVNKSTPNGSAPDRGPLLILAGSIALAFLWLVAISTVSWVLVRYLAGIHGPALFQDHPVALVALPVIFFAISALLGRWSSLINRSSLASLYSARLTRAYLGATNPERMAKDESAVTKAVAGDQINFQDYNPHWRNGPLHLINVTLNQTVDSKSAVTRGDRKGLGMTVGPCGLSVGVTHHATWVVGEDNRRTDRVIAAPPADFPPGAFHLFVTKDKKEITVEGLGLGEWIGISGAAFSTGLGAGTNPALSFVLGFFNIRLGWWWNCGASPSDRPGQVSRAAGRMLEESASVFFDLQEHLLSEFTARFHGPARKRWYLTDGGHFENTAAYELIRRQTRLIIICDDGCDPARAFDDFANLVRKARLDFQTEITMLTETEIQQCVPKTARPFFGTYDQLQSPHAAPYTHQACATLARARYASSDARDSLILLLKPTVTGEEPVDVRNYAGASAKFPQESTMDQFFSEAQWESYRQLGYQIGSHVFADPEMSPEKLTARFMSPPPAGKIPGT